MEVLRTYFWAILLLASLLVTLVIIMIFIIINVCISKRAAEYQAQTKPNDYSDPKCITQDKQVYHKHVENEKPPLPPRDQFQSMDSANNSYGHVEPLPDYVDIEELNPAELHQAPFIPQYTTVKTKTQTTVCTIEDNDDVEMPANFDSEDYDDVG